MGQYKTTFEEHYKPRQEAEALHGVEYQLPSEESQDIRVYKDEHEKETVSGCGSLVSLS
jgi:hypothetical protein